MDVAAAVHIAISALKRLDQAASLLSAAGRPRPRLFFADCIWIADYGETLLAEPGVSAYLNGSALSDSAEMGADAERQDLLAIAIELFQLASGKLLYGDLASALRSHLPETLGRMLTGLLLFDSVSEGYTASSLAEALASLPENLIGNDELVATELRRLAADLLEERERKLSVYRTGTSGGTDGPTRVYTGGMSDYDADERTIQVNNIQRGLPVHLFLRPNRALPSPAAREVPFGPRSQQQPPPSMAPSPAQPRVSEPRRLGWAWLLAIVLVLGVVGAANHYRPAWFVQLVARLQALR
jgi:hypothetical protein